MSIKKLPIILLFLSFIIIIFISCEKNTTESNNSNSDKKTDVLFNKFIPYMKYNNYLEFYEGREGDDGRAYYTADTIYLVLGNSFSATCTWKTPYAINTNYFSEIKFSLTASNSNDSLSLPAVTNAFINLGFDHNQYIIVDSIPLGNIEINHVFQDYMFTTDSTFFAFKLTGRLYSNIKLYDLEIIATRKE